MSGEDPRAFFAHDDADCNGTRCEMCGCCMHSDVCALDYPCPDPNCGCGALRLGVES